MNAAILLVTVSALLGCTVSANYCSIKSCSRHTMCIHPRPGPSSQCRGYKKGGLTAEERAIVLHEHNVLRSKVAMGKESGFPQAANMKIMTWDEELATIAQRWADQCKFSHDKCRNSERFYVGQNIATWSTSGGSMDIKANLKQMVNNWYSEVKYTPKSQVQKFTNRGNGGMIGHFTQLIWAESDKLGCGFTQTQEGGWNKVTLMCNYGPGGNMFSSPIYKKGRPCSKCLGGTRCSSNYNGLCARK